MSSTPTAISLSGKASRHTYMYLTSVVVGLTHVTCKKTNQTKNQTICKLLKGGEMFNNDDSGGDFADAANDEEKEGEKEEKEEGREGKGVLK